MKGNEFEIIIGADGKPLTRTLKEMQADLKDFGRQLENTLDPRIVAGLNKSIKDTQKNIAALKGAGVGAFSGLKPGAKDASFALNDVSRIAQDLPYGLIGIQNNINPLIESFARAKREAGGVGGALKAMAGSLAGPGGLGLAVAVVSSAFVIFQNGIQGFNRKTKEAKEEVDKLRSSLKSVSQVQKEAGASAEAELVKVRTLAAVIMDVNTSNEIRKRGILELRQVSKAHFGDLENEAKALGLLAGKVDEYTRALVQAAAFKAFGDEVSQVSKNLILQGIKLDDLKGKYKEAAAAQDELNAPAKRNKAGFIQVNKNVQQLRDLAAQLDERKKSFAEQKKIVFELEDQIVLFSKKQDEAIRKSLELKSLTAPETVKAGKDSSVLENLINTNELRRFTPFVEAAGEGWQKLIDFSEKQADRYYSEWAKNIAAADKKQKVIDAFNGTNADIQKGIVGFKPQGQTDPFGGLDIKATEDIQKALQKLQKLNVQPRDVSYLSDQTAQLFILNTQIKEATANLQLMGERMGTVGKISDDFLRPAFTNLFGELVNGTKTVGDAFKDMLKSIVKQMVATLATAAALAAIMSVFGGGGFGTNFINALGGSGKGGSGLGNIFDKLFKGSSTAFAGGGGGPLVGGGGNTMGSMAALNVVVTGRMSGRDVLFTSDRTRRSIDRLGG